MERSLSTLIIKLARVCNSSGILYKTEGFALRQQVLSGSYTNAYMTKAHIVSLQTHFPAAKACLVVEYFIVTVSLFQCLSDKNSLYE